MEGVDYANGWSPGLGAKLAAAGKQFACRYLSGGQSKDLTAAEIADLEGAGLAIVVVWETDGKTGPLEGAAGGREDAGAAVTQAANLGVPAETCIYFAVDFEPSAADLPALQAYADAVKEVCHPANYRCGIYGGLSTIQAVSGRVECLWQTYAWSGGQWAANTNLQQYQNGVALAGIEVDLDRSTTDDFGQFGGDTLSSAEFDQLRGEIADLRAQTNATQGQVNNHTNQITVLQGEVKALQDAPPSQPDPTDNPRLDALEKFQHNVKEA